jgi:hypothetical protein
MIAKPIAATAMYVAPRTHGGSEEARSSPRAASDVTPEPC